jgi:hypothetical protein
MNFTRILLVEDKASTWDLDFNLEAVFMLLFSITKFVGCAF